MNLILLKDIAVKAALEAGELIKKYMNEDVPVELKTGGTNYASQVVTHVDKACEKIILDQLLPTCEEFDIAILTEETEDDGSRFQKDYFWCVDPIDGTLSFIEKRAGFSVSIALVANDGTPTIGVIYDPRNHILYTAIKGYGVFKNGNPWEIQNSNSYLTYVTDKTLEETPNKKFIERKLDEIINQHNLDEYRVQSGMGSVLNAIHVLENGPAVMMKLPKQDDGGGSIWDFAATACLFQELDLIATNYKGENLDLNRKENSFMNHEGIFYSNIRLGNQN